MKLRTLIIDDEPLAHDIILKYAEDVPFLEICGQCHLATDALVFLGKNPVDLIFLDIQMPKLKGIDFLKTLNTKPLVIVTSAYENYALESFELDVCDYLLKPFRFDRFLKAAHKALELYRLKHPSAENLPEKNQSETHLFIKSDNRIVQVEIEEIFCLESYGNYVKVWQKEGFLLTPRTLSSFEKQLSATDFIRIHKSFLVNKKQVKYLEGNALFLKNGKELPIGKNHRQAFKGLIFGDLE